jgi:hypothetical protein
MLTRLLRPHSTHAEQGAQHDAVVTLWASVRIRREVEALLDGIEGDFVFTSAAASRGRV